MPSNRKKVLIVEDETDIRFLYSTVLKSAGYIVDEAPNGEIGLEKIKSTDWNILLLDIMLPGKDGLKILQDIKESPEYKKGPIVCLTNLNSDTIIQESFKAGSDDYLIKSEITPDRIVAEVEKLIGHSQK